MNARSMLLIIKLKTDPKTELFNKQIKDKKFTLDQLFSDTDKYIVEKTIIDGNLLAAYNKDLGWLKFNETGVCVNKPYRLVRLANFQMLKPDTIIQYYSNNKFKPGLFKSYNTDTDKVLPNEMTTADNADIEVSPSLVWLYI